MWFRQSWAVKQTPPSDSALSVSLPFKDFLTLFAERLCCRPTDGCRFSANHETLSVFFVFQMFFLSPSLIHSFVHITVCSCRNSLHPPTLGSAVLLCSTMRKGFSNRFWHIFYRLEEKGWTDGETGNRVILYVLRMYAFFYSGCNVSNHTSSSTTKDSWRQEKDK